MKSWRQRYIDKWSSGFNGEIYVLVAESSACVYDLMTIRFRHSILLVAAMMATTGFLAGALKRGTDIGPIPLVLCGAAAFFWYWCYQTGCEIPRREAAVRAAINKLRGLHENA